MAAEKIEKQEESSRMTFSNREYLGFATYARSKSGQWRLHFNWRRIFVVLVSLALLGYLALAGLLYCWFKYKHEWDGTKYTTMLVFPFDVDTRVNLRRAIGDKIIKDAREEFQQKKDFGEYFQKVRAGLAYSSHNPDARIDFASLLFYQKRTREAFEFLSENLPYAITHKTYVPFFVRQSLELTQDDVLADSADTLLPLFPIAGRALPDSQTQALADNRLVLAIGAAQANLLRGRFLRSREILETYKVGDSLSGRVLAAQIAWELGDRPTALSILKNALAAAPGNEQISMLYALYLKENGDLREARNVLTRLVLYKNDPSVRVKVITLFPGDENAAHRKRLEDEFFQRYKNDSAALLVFAQYATDSKNFELTERIYNHARSAALIDLPKFELLYLESLVLDGKSKQALDILDELTKGNYAWVKHYQGVLDCLHAIAYYSNDQANLGKINLDRVLKNQSVPVARLIVLARRLDFLGFEDEARNVYENAFLLENGNQSVLLELVRYALRHEDVSVLVRYLPPLLETRRPPRSVLEKVQNFLGSDRMLFVVKRESLVNSITSMLDETKNDQLVLPEDVVLESWF